MPQNNTRTSRYDVTCPVCGARFLGGRFGFEGSGCRCPSCGELLESRIWLNPQLLWLISAIVTAVGAFLLGFRGWSLMFLVVVGSLVVLFLVTTVLFHVSPPKAQQSAKNGDTVLRLTDEKRRRPKL